MYIARRCEKLGINNRRKKDGIYSGIYIGALGRLYIFDREVVHASAPGGARPYATPGLERDCGCWSGGHVLLHEVRNIWNEIDAKTD